METGNTAIDAQTAFARQRRRRRLARLADALGLRRRSAALPCLESPGGSAGVGSRASGLRAVPVDEIAGTAEPAKARMFDAAFRPPASSRRRWERIWMAARRGGPLPPISVLRSGGRYFVNDGHHRVSVALALGMAAIDAEVTELG